MGVFKGLVFMMSIMLMVFNGWLAYIAFFISDVTLFGVLHTFISLGSGFIVYRLGRKGI